MNKKWAIWTEFYVILTGTHTHTGIYAFTNLQTLILLPTTTLKEFSSKYREKKKKKWFYLKKKNMGYEYVIKCKSFAEFLDIVIIHSNTFATAKKKKGKYIFKVKEKDLEQ